MKTIILPLLTSLTDVLRSRASLHLELLSLRQQLAMVANRGAKRIRFSQSQRFFGFGSIASDLAAWSR